MALINISHYSNAELILHNDDLVKIVLTKAEKIFQWKTDEHINSLEEKQKYTQSSESSLLYLEEMENEDDGSNPTMLVFWAIFDKVEHFWRSTILLLMSINQELTSLDLVLDPDYLPLEMNLEDRRLSDEKDMNWEKKEEKLCRKKRRELTLEKEDDNDEIA
ncbi:hypothetical protein F5I97DRAFT_1931404 [Phlebopus sp. FC_14]|nr:hypothetical protein F5I97DRAFT_1931404 [Phlebopus sp. FC_14]